MYRRRLMILIILAVVALLGLLLFISMRPSNLFRIAAPVVTPVTETTDLTKLKNVVSTTTVAAVSTTTLLEKPRYTGQDSLGRSWLLSATSAGQEGTTSSGTYILNQVEATFSDPSQTTPQGNTFTLSAEKGRYTQTSSTLKLSGAVSATGIGFNLTAPEVDADLNTRKLKATGGSRITGNAGGWNVDITAPTLKADQISSTLQLTGGVHAKFIPTKAK